MSCASAYQLPVCVLVTPTLFALLKFLRLEETSPAAMALIPSKLCTKSNNYMIFCGTCVLSINSVCGYKPSREVSYAFKNVKQ